MAIYIANDQEGRSARNRREISSWASKSRAFTCTKSCSSCGQGHRRAGDLVGRMLDPLPPEWRSRYIYASSRIRNTRLLALSVGRSIGGGGLLKFIAVSKESTHLEET
ncbi:hypothetical protein EAG_01711 [Camponotus floridanus]|uniref:Uncharacterized protein n=1 Tax=Camponotus floridanus TaxID=104421 RepID=E2AX76_CAMFO|nr:hypothetical protein EAG_01711 [Camponotus floridanus]